MKMCFDSWSGNDANDSKGICGTGTAKVGKDRKQYSLLVVVVEGARIGNSLPARFKFWLEH